MEDPVSFFSVASTDRVCIGGAKEAMLKPRMKVRTSPKKIDLVIIEVWQGSLLDENDITRYHDIYNRI